MAAPVIDQQTTGYRLCKLCEAGCGLEIVARGKTVVSIRGDKEDVFSKGYICPKGAALKHLHDDPDRLRTPLIKRDGVFRPASWGEAFAEVERGLRAVIETDGGSAVGLFIGNQVSDSYMWLEY